MFECTFELNGEPLSSFKVGASTYPAFSGLEPYVNKRSAACMENLGPIPPGEYFIFDRQSGGLLGPLRDALRDRSGWFALHAIDGKIDDEAYCEAVKRGAFRLHPKGRLGISQGCIVIDTQADFNRLATLLKSVKPQPVKGSDLLAYGRVRVK